MIINIAGEKNSGKDTVASMVQYLLTENPNECMGFLDWIDFNGIDYHQRNDWMNSTIKTFAEPLEQTVSAYTGIHPSIIRTREVKDGYWNPATLEFITADVMRDRKVDDPTLQISGDYNGIGLGGATNIRSDMWYQVRALYMFFGTMVGRNVFNVQLWSNLALKDHTSDNTTIFSDLRFKSELESCKKVDDKVFTIGIIRNETGLPFDGDDITFDKGCDLRGSDCTNLIANCGTLEDLYELIEDFINNIKGNALPISKA